MLRGATASTDAVIRLPSRVTTPSCQQLSRKISCPDFSTTLDVEIDRLYMSCGMVPASRVCMHCTFVNKGLCFRDTGSPSLWMGVSIRGASCSPFAFRVLCPLKSDSFVVDSSYGRLLSSHGRLYLLFGVVSWFMSCHRFLSILLESPSAFFSPLLGSLRFVQVFQL